MTITPIFRTGAEVGSANEWPSSSALTMGASTTQKKTGAYSWGIASNELRYGIVQVTATRQLRIGMQLYSSTTIDDTTPLQLVAFRNSAGTHLCRFEITGSAGNNRYIADVNGTDQDFENSMVEGAWHHVGIDIKIDSSAGWFVVYRDKTEVLRFEGNTGNADIADVAIGNNNSRNIGNTTFIDDIYIDDTTSEAEAAIVPVKAFPYLTTNGNGNYNGNWEGSDGNNTDNYLLVDDVPIDSDTTYVSETAADQLESFAMTTYTIEVGTVITAAIPLAICKYVGGSERIAVGTRYNSTDVIGSDQTAGNLVYINRWARQTTKPGGGRVEPGRGRCG